METPTPLTPAEHLREFVRCSLSPIYFVCTYVYINHPLNGVIPFTLWPWQADLLRTIHREQQVIVLKSRQLGVSELAVAYALWLVSFAPAKTVLFLSKNDEDAKNLLRRVKFSHTHLPPFLQCRIGDDNMSRWQVVHLDGEGQPHHSEIRSLPATVGAGRSASASLVVLDEWAHQQFADEIWAAVQPTTAAGGKLLGISTANGIGNTFHAIWQKAETGENSFRAVFLPWHKHPDRDQAWYDRTAADLDQPWRMHQEHPSTAAEAFVQSGRPVFASEILATHEARVRRESAPLPLPDMPIWMPDGLTLYALPEQGHDYIIGADVAEGLPHGDWSVAAVADRATHVQVAELRGHWTPEAYAQKLDWLGRYFINALLAVERNNHGHAVLLALTSGLANGEHKPYPRVYRHKDPLLKRGEALDARPGWPTTTVTKPLIIDTLGKCLRDGSYQPQSLVFLAEARIFAIQNNGSMSAPSGFCDDAVMAHAICCYLCGQPQSAGLDLLRERDALRAATAHRNLPQDLPL